MPGKADQVSNLRQRFLDGLTFEVDRFQLEAFDSVDAGHNVVVAAPTGAGKTLVATYAVDAAIAHRRRVFFTTPIKALSNQKYHELVERLGVNHVGLLTGDNAINPDASVVVMTTEVLRNMLYAGKSLDTLRSVVLDEVHYLQDAYRGPVWEEVIIHLPQHIGLVCLSATVSNAEELTEWMQTVRGTTDLVVETTRPVRLENSYLVGERSNSHLHLTKTVQRGRPNPKGIRFDNTISKRRKRAGNERRHSNRKKWRTPAPRDIVLLLEEKDMLPAIHFIFSRAGCDEATKSVLSSGLSLTSRAEQSEIRAIVNERTAGLSKQDRKVLDFAGFRRGLEAGVASHHAGMIPPFKEAVEQCFVRGLIKIVFATETLALGVNMPARTVVLDKLSKFTGEHHEHLTPAQYTQLTGRAGRRGIDTLGHALVLWSPFVEFEQVAELAMSRSFVLRSSFRPTYNMAANLIRRYQPEEARQLLNMSFAQFRVDANVVHTEQQTSRLEARRKQIQNKIEREFGPVDHLRALIDGPFAQILDREAIDVSLTHLSPGDVIRFVLEDEPMTGAVVAVAFRRKGRIKVVVVDASTERFELRPDALAQPVETVSRIELPEPYLPNSVSYHHEVSQLLVRQNPNLATSKTGSSSTGDEEVLGGQRDPTEPLLIRRKADIPQRARRSLKRLERIEGDLQRRATAAARRAETLAAQFDAIVALLEDRGYVNDWNLEPRGQRLARLYHECDLLIIECLEQGVFDDLSAAELAGVVSVFVYNGRRSDSDAEIWFPSKTVAQRVKKIQSVRRNLVKSESASGLVETRQVEAGFVAVAHAWASGGDIDDVLLDEPIPAGDFIRTIKQLIDVLNQLATLSPNPETAKKAQVASEALFRDLVLASAAVSVASETPEESKDESADQ